MSYTVPGRLQRGPMAADKFTQIHNEVFRDPTLSAKAKAIFGFVSTHKDGWGVTEASIIAHMAEGRDAVRKALKELEGRGYIVRERTKGEDGKFGAYVWFFTDLPAQLRDAGITDNDVVLARVREEFDDWLAYTKPQVKPVTENQSPENQVPENPTHKKTNSKKTIGELASDDGLAPRSDRGGSARESTSPLRDAQRELLSSVGASVSIIYQARFHVGGPDLTDAAVMTHARYANTLIEDHGWAPEALVLMLALGHPPNGVRNLGAFITSRLKSLARGDLSSVLHRYGAGRDEPPSVEDLAELLEEEQGVEVDVVGLSRSLRPLRAVA